MDKRQLRTRPPIYRAHIVVGPIRGIGHIEDFAEKARDFSTKFRVCLSKQMQPDQKVVLDPKCPTPDEFETGCPKFSIDLHFINSNGNLNCVFTLKEFQKGTVLHVTRKTLFSESRDIESKLAEEIAHQVSDAIWRSYITNTGLEATPSSSPLHVSLFDAADKLSNRRGNWKDNDAILRRAVSDDDNDSVAKLMLATNIHLKYIEDGMETMLGPDTRLQDENEVESLVLSCLPHIQSNDILVLAAAKLLFFLDRGYRRFAVEMAENAFRNSTAIATSLTIVGQMRMFLGEFDQAIDFLNQAQELSEDGTQFQYYLMFIKCQTYMAAGNWVKLREALDEFYEKVPETKYSVSIFFASAGDNNISPEAKVMANNITKEKAVAILNITNYVYARLFTDDEPKLNIFRGLVAVMSECFGSEIIPDEIRSSIPILFQANQS